MSKKFNRVTSGPSSLEIVTIPDPAIGDNFTIPLEEGYSYFAISLTFHLDTNAIVALRIPIIRALLADRTLWVAVGEGSQVNDEILLWNFCVGGFRQDFSALGAIMVADLPPGVFIPGGSRLVSDTLFLNAGDQLYNVYAYLQKWPILED